MQHCSLLQSKHCHFSLISVSDSPILYIYYITTFDYGFDICDRPRENRPSSHLRMIVEIPVLKVVISITSFCSSLLSRIVLSFKSGCVVRVENDEMRSQLQPNKTKIRLY